ncbi:MAG: hypothetical protein COT15_01895 [Candidatus Diapherotrites archaeon CG08_land_8_20_14_0_20_34_12]|nr:MAG: hypothetical protein COT15_01895 [Candidatus Diapherotrites archaeon CG08_land_8_20_14_0_20_34_12]
MVVVPVESSKIFVSSELNKIVEELVSYNSNLIIFGLPNSGKSTLVKRVCSFDPRFKTLEHEEVLSAEDNKRLLRKCRKLWCVGHQYPTQNQNVSADYLQWFVAGMGLDIGKWAIIRILLI